MLTLAALSCALLSLAAALGGASAQTSQSFADSSVAVDTSKISNDLIKGPIFSPFPCPIVLCAAPKPGCFIVFDDLVDQNGCAVNPCGIEICPSPPPPPIGVFLGIDNGPKLDIIFTLSSTEEISGLQFEITKNGQPASTSFAFNSGLPNNFAVLQGTSTIAVAVDAQPLTSTNGFVNAVQAGVVDGVPGDEICLLSTSVVSAPLGLSLPYTIVQPDCVILGGSPPPPPPPPKKCPQLQFCPFAQFKPVGCLFVAELAQDSILKLSQEVAKSNAQFEQFADVSTLSFAASADEVASGGSGDFDLSSATSASFEGSASLPTASSQSSRQTGSPASSGGAGSPPVLFTSDLIAAASPNDLLQVGQLVDKIRCPISFCSFTCPSPPPPPPPPTPCPGVTKGDVDSNGLVQVIDLVILISKVLTTSPDALANSPPCTFFADDLNGDNVLSILDTVLLSESILN